MAKTSERYFVYSSDCDIDQDEEERLLGFGSDEEDSGPSISDSMENQLLGYGDDKLDQTNMVKGTTEHIGKSDEPVGIIRADVPVRFETASKVKDATEHTKRSGESIDIKSADVPVRLEFVNKVKHATEPPMKSRESIDIKNADVPVRLELANDKNRLVNLNAAATEKAHDMNNNKVLGHNVTDIRKSKVKIGTDTCKYTMATGNAINKAEANTSRSSLEFIRGESLRMRKQKVTDVIPNSGKTDSYPNETTDKDINLELDEVERGMVEQIADADDLLEEIDEFFNVEYAKQNNGNQKDTGTKSVKASDKDMTALILKRFGTIDNFLDKMDEFFNVTCEKQEYKIHDVEDIDKTDSVSDERNTVANIPKRRINKLKQPEVTTLSHRNDDIIEAPNGSELSGEESDKSNERTSIRIGCENVKITAVPKGEHETEALPVKSSTDENESRIVESITDSSNSSSDDDLSMKSASSSSSEIYDTTENDCRIVKLSRTFNDDEKETENVELDLQVFSSSEDIQSMKSTSSTSTETFSNIEDDYNTIKPSVDSYNVNSYSIESASWTSTETSEIDEHYNHGDVYEEQQDNVLTVDDGYDMWQAYYSGTEYAFDTTEQSEDRVFYGVAENNYDVETIDHTHTIMHEYDTEAILNNNNDMAANDVKPRFIFINPAKMPPMIDVTVDGNIESPEYDIEFA